MPYNENLSIVASVAVFLITAAVIGIFGVRMTHVARRLAVTLAVATVGAEAEPDRSRVGDNRQPQRDP